MKNLAIVLTLIFAQSVFADSMRIQTPAYQKTIHTNGVTITDLQPKLRCHFVHSKRGVNKFARRYIFAHTKAIDSDDSEIQRYKVVSKRGKLWTALPGFEVQSCAYVLIVMGRDKHTNRSLIGDIVLIGQMQGKMTTEELNMFKDKQYIANYLNKRLDDMVLVPGKDSRGRARIINLYD